MQIQLKERTEETVKVYYEKSQDPRITATLPRRDITLEQALEEYRASLLPGAGSFGQTIWADGEYVGDIWCYGIGREASPQAMLSYCVFEPTFWGKGIATQALALFLPLLETRFALRDLGAFTFSANLASCRLLEKAGFVCREEFEEEGVLSRFYQKSPEERADKSGKSI